MSRTLPSLPLWPASKALPANAITLFYDPDTNLEYRIDPARLGEVELKKLQEQLNTLNSFKAGQIGTDSPAGSLLEQLKWLAGRPGSVTTIVQSPDVAAAPTEVQVNDVSKEWQLTANPLYPSFAQYKINGLPGTTGPVYLSATNSYQVGPTIYVKVGSGVPKGGLAIYVAGSGNVPDGQVCTNSEAFTGVNVPTTPTPGPALTAALAISVASIVAGTPLTFEVTAGGGTAPYSYAVKATNNATGAVTVLGSSASGSFTPQTGGTTYNIDATVTDAAGKVAPAVTRTVQVTAPQSVNQLPVANAGQDLTITLPTSSVALMGNGTDADGTIAGYHWELLAGPQSAPALLGLPANTKNVVVSGFVAGAYQFELIVTDDKGGTNSDFVVVTVNAQPTTDLGPAYVYAFMPDQSNGSGLSPRAGLPAKYNHVDPRHMTWNDLTGKIEIWQLGVNDNSINSRKWPDAVTGEYIVPSFMPSFGPDAGLGAAFLADPSNTGKSVYTFKLWLGIRDGETVNSNSTTTTIWLNEFYPKLIKQWNAFKAALLAKGHSSVVTVGMYSGLGEGNQASEQANYKADMKLLFSKLLADGIRQAATKCYLLAKQPAQYAAIRALQQELSAELGFPMLVLPNPSYIDGIHYTQESMIRMGEMDYDPSLSATAPANSGGNGALDQGTFTNIASPANTQVLNLRYNAGKALDASSWTSDNSRNLAVRQPKGGARGIVVSGGIQFTAGNQYMYSDSYNFSALGEMTWVFYARGLVKSSSGNNAQSFFYNGDEDTQGAFSCYWDEANNTICARVHSLASPAGNRDLAYYYFVTVPFTGGDCMMTVRYNKNRTTDCIRVTVNGVVGTVFGNANKQPAFFLDGIVALFGRNEPGETAIRGTVQQVSVWNYELTDASLATATNGYKAEVPVAGTNIYDVLATSIQVTGTTYTRGGTDSWGALGRVSTKRLPANTTGGVRWKVSSAADKLTTMGLHKNNQPAGVLAMDFCTYLNNSFALDYFTAGNYAGSSVQLSDTFDLYVYRKADMSIVVQVYVASQSQPVIEKILGSYAGDLWHTMDMSGGGQLSNPELIGFA
jgi:hypothetical protein